MPVPWPDCLKSSKSRFWELKARLRHSAVRVALFSPGMRCLKLCSPFRSCPNDHSRGFDSDAEAVGFLELNGRLKWSEPDSCPLTLVALLQVKIYVILRALRIL